MTQNTGTPNQYYVDNEYDPLQKVILCSPQYMQIRDVINRTQEKYAQENIDTPLANHQHQTLVQTLEQNGVEVIQLPPEPNYPEQVFTRDIGFTIGQHVFVAQLDHSVRQGEEKILKEWLIQQHVLFYPIASGTIEGGDVLVDGNKVWVGNSGRTSNRAVDELRSRLPNYEIMNVPFDPDYLHLDCVFNMISAKEALIFPPAFSNKTLHQLADAYEWIEVSEEEQFTLGANVLSIGEQTIISQPMNRRVNEQLRKRGYTVIEVDISEIIKSGGAFRCITMPLLRSSQPS